MFYRYICDDSNKRERNMRKLINYLLTTRPFCEIYTHEMRSARM